MSKTAVRKAPPCLSGKKRHAWGLIEGRTVGDIYSGTYVASRTCSRCGVRKDTSRGQTVYVLP